MKASNKERGEYRQQRNESQLKIDDLQQTLRAQKRDSDKKISDLEKEIADLSSNKDHSVEQLERGLRDLERERDEMRDQRDRKIRLLEEDVQTLRAEKEKYSASLFQLEASKNRGSPGSTDHALVSKISRLESEIQSLLGEKEISRENAARLEGELFAAERERDVLKSQRDARSGKSAQLENEIKTLVAERKQLRNKIDELTMLLAEAESKFVELEKGTKLRAAMLSTEVTATVLDFERVLEALQIKLEGSGSTSDTAQSAAVGIVDMLTKLDTHTQMLQGKVKDLVEGQIVGDATSEDASGGRSSPLDPATKAAFSAVEEMETQCWQV